MVRTGISSLSRYGGASSLRRETRRRLVASFLRGEMHGTAGSGLSTYRYPIGLVRTTHIGRYRSKRRTLLHTSSYGREMLDHRK
ncbi:hypothetical protein B296_00059096 [Ensete ventricosum]|uniref:Uncharacterized protein n=1 Tax=Ensete ventricosum TaxID=4639 RepID=A0A426XJ29_ENSVE|nr:hypothetical protein B296_00059096 [Ensete ventricosum]